ncbi:hypothetical protein [uncultured Pelagimonas sp.]|uniref:hypothetical protein n=1 Tax=uncultured Pelagimonas sp. TaxID=1618102 RepID=UPI00261061F0|nr:hypothetical protein [uncultured Pelagimonas sp.]
MAKASTKTQAEKTKPESVPSAYQPYLDGDPRTRDPMILPEVDGLMLSLQGGVRSTVGDDFDLADAPVPIDPKTLNRHLISCTAFTRDVKGNVSFFSSLFKAEAEGKKVGVVQEAKVFFVKTDSNGVAVEHGVAVRLQVDASKFSAEANVSIPNIAAEAQLGMSDAQMEISVRGFSGFLGALLPAPDTVNLTSYAAYMEAFQKIQKHVFCEENAEYLVPVVLGKHKPVEQLAS